MEPLIILHNNQPCTNSLLVAEKFQKEHKVVLKAIRELGCSQNFSRHNFMPSDYTNDRGKTYPLYIITKDGFTMLAMSFTGDIAAKFKEDYINAFNQMEAKLKRQMPTHALPVYRNRILSEP